jgi:hypothetical protein
MKSLQKFQIKKISNLNRNIGGGWVHTSGCCTLVNGEQVTRDIFYDTNGDGSCNTFSEFQSMSYVK